MSEQSQEDFFQEVDQMLAGILSEVNSSTDGQYNYNKDILTGEEGEEFIKNFLISKGFEFIKNNKNKDYDLLMSYEGREITYEVKTDVYVGGEKDKGNIAIEFECRGVPSGIAATKADYFVIYMPKIGQIWNIRTKKLKNLIKNNNFRQTSQSGDKGSNTKLYLIPRKEFERYFKIYKL